MGKEEEDDDDDDEGDDEGEEEEAIEEFGTAVEGRSKCCLGDGGAGVTCGVIAAGELIVGTTTDFVFV